MFFRYAHFSRIAVSSRPEHHFWGWRGAQRTANFLLFLVFLEKRFFEGPRLTFWGFGRFGGPPKSTLTLANPSIYLMKWMVFIKSCFFIKKKWVSKKTWFFINFGPPKSTTIHQQVSLFGSFFCVFSRSPSQTPKKHPKSSQKVVKKLSKLIHFCIFLGCF